MRSSDTWHFSIFGQYIVLLLSWLIVLIGTYSLCAPNKWLIHSNCAMASLIATNSASVELYVFSFCLRNGVYIALLKSVMNMPL